MVRSLIGSSARKARALVCFILLFSAPLALRANPYDSLLTDSQWYVPSDNLLAYVASGTDLTSNFPVADQTIWTITDCTNGSFTGTSVATFNISPTVSGTSTTTINGLVTDSGQMRIDFTNSNGVTIGLGQVRDISGTSYVEMQMITAADGAGYITHWAYMAPYVSGDIILPSLDTDPTPADTPWDWLAGTTWELNSPNLFAGATPFTITGYNGGYFWGTGGTTDPFTIIGSATPEGNLLFDVLLDGSLTSLTGQITGDQSNGAMVMNSYSVPDGFNTSGAAFLVVPEPSSIALLGISLVAIVLCRSRIGRRPLE